LSANANSASALIAYMSQRLLEVAELNTVLDQFSAKTLFPASGHRRSTPYTTYIPGWDSWDFGGFDFQEQPLAPLQTRALTAQDRAELEALGLF
jgi:hypothetical protein